MSTKAPGKPPPPEPINPSTANDQPRLYRPDEDVANMFIDNTNNLKVDTESLLSTEDDKLPPPAYGEVYGEVTAEQDGAGASAAITNDGRVNIRVNQLNRRLSQIFTPAYRPDVEDPLVQSGNATQSDLRPPKLNIVIQVVGSRGDVQPFVALGRVLKNKYGHRVRLATHPIFRKFVEDAGLEFFSIGGDPARLMASMVKNPSLMPGFRSIFNGEVGQRRRDVAEYIQGCWRSCYEAGDGVAAAPAGDTLRNTSKSMTFVADCIIANPPSFAHIHCAEKLGVPLHIMFTMPYSPTSDFPHPLANIQSTNADAQFTNYISYVMIEILSWQGLGSIINRFRAKCLNLDPVSRIWAPGMLQRLKIPHTYCWSPALIPKPRDWASHISVAGFYMLDLASDYSPPPELQTFLNAGPPPIYIGFGSIVLEDPDAMTKLIFDAVKKTGRRALISKGWGGMTVDHVPDNVMMLGNVPHDWLFRQVACVVHHGGAGTTAAGIAAGRPTFVVPFFGDQQFWGSMIAKAGAGPEPIHHKKLTSDNLAAAIQFCLLSSTVASAAQLANEIAGENGCDAGAQHFHRQLQVDELRCSLSTSKSATWRLRKTTVQLSPFAACTLVNADLLNFKDLKLFRPREYETDEGAWDPISGFAAATFGAMSSISVGLAGIPGETSRAFKLPFRDRGKGSSSDAISVASKSRITSSTAVATSGNAGGDTRPNTQQDMMRRKGAHGSKGVGQMVTSTLASPMDMSVAITKGFHNLPKTWGDTTVRPQQQVTDLQSGMTAIGKEFGFGFYDGVTGLVTQPYKGAQKDGVTGFFKGVGKGVGGFVAKPGSALFGIPAYFMKGIQKETQKWLGGNLQNHIIAARIAQGYDEWSQSTEEEKRDVVERWHLIQKYFKKGKKPEELIREALHSHQPYNADVYTAGHDSNAPAEAVSGLQHSRAHEEIDRTTQRPENQRQVLDRLRRAAADSETEAQRHAAAAIEYQRQLQQLTQDETHFNPRRLSMSDHESEIGLNDEEDEAFERAIRLSEKEARDREQATTRR